LLHRLISAGLPVRCEHLARLPYKQRFRRLRTHSPADLFALVAEGSLQVGLKIRFKWRYMAHTWIMSENDPATVKAKPGKGSPEASKPPAEPPTSASAPEVSDADLERFRRRYGLM
jgi:hypothetical protein